MKFLQAMLWVLFLALICGRDSVVGMKKEPNGRDLSVWTWEKENNRWMLKKQTFYPGWDWNDCGSNRHVINITTYLTQNNIHLDQLEFKRGSDYDMPGWNFFTWKEKPEKNVHQKSVLKENYDLWSNGNEICKYAILFSNFEQNIDPSRILQFGTKSPPTICNESSFGTWGPKFLTDEKDLDEKKIIIEKIRKEEIEIAAREFKIHLQIKPNYLFSFVKDFTWFVIETGILEKIEQFKVTINYKDRFNDKKIPVLVIYLDVANPKKAYEKIDFVIDLLIDRYGNISEDIALQYKDGTKTQVSQDVDLKEYVVPRFNRKINEFIYVAGGGGDLKKKYNSFLFNNLYTQDFAFFLGCEYTYIPPNQRKNREEESFVDKFKSSLEKLKQMLGKLKNALIGGC
jgi:hypothetical protein